MAMDLFLLLAFAGGLIAGVVNPRPWLAVAVLLVLAAGSVAIVAWWQSANPENLRSTSGLEFLFGPLMPVGGYILGRAARSFGRVGL